MYTLARAIVFLFLTSIVKRYKSRNFSGKNSFSCQKTFFKYIFNVQCS
uniref:Uncharacterized protein n=1 Tax=Siphoviridae sp. ctCCX1 TaxID=2823567 RepID=A0A8S5LDM3_9CAUD|nr:MAG TPA: hypothetical protein [Siphoviridae sp. ctCCX1]